MYKKNIQINRVKPKWEKYKNAISVGVLKMYTLYLIQIIRKDRTYKLAVKEQIGLGRLWYLEAGVRRILEGFPSKVSVEIVKCMEGMIKKWNIEYTEEIKIE